MKNFVSIAGLTFLLTCGCSLVGTNPSAPAGPEKLIFDTTTNYVPVTNMVAQVTQVARTNANGTITVANQTNLVPQVALQPTYTETVKPSVTSGAQAAGSVLNAFFPGTGALAVNALLALLGGWAYLRSNKQKDTSAALTQEIQTILNFVGQLPSGDTYVATLKNFMQAHQTEADVTAQVLSLLAQEVSNTDAKAAANQVIATINSLKTVTAPVAPITQTL